MHKLTDLLVREPVPDAVARQYDKLGVIRSQSYSVYVGCSTHQWSRFLKLAVTESSATCGEVDDRQLF
jgi:hypothetical protein